MRHSGDCGTILICPVPNMESGVINLLNCLRPMVPRLRYKQGRGGPNGGVRADGFPWVLSYWSNSEKTWASSNWSALAWPPLARTADPGLTGVMTFAWLLSDIAP
jgi:hypothetical protein